MKKIVKQVVCGILTLAVAVSGLTLPTKEVSAASKTWNKINGVCYNGNGKVIPNAITRGIDVSEWQGTINWTKVASSNVDFAMIRVGHRSGSSLVLDDYYTRNIQGATAAGIPTGVYFYSKARTVAQAQAEANYVLSKVKGYKISYPIAFDLEDSSLLSGLTNKKRANITMAFCNTIKAAGYYPLLYCNTTWYNNYIDQATIAGIDKWLASYADRFTSAGTTAKHTIWQATSGATSSGLKSTKGLIAGIPTSNSVDINFGYVDYTKVITPRTGTKSVRKGWYTTKAGYTYYYKSGKKVTGWQTIGGKRYYFSTSGRMQTGKKKIGKYYFYFAPKKTSKYNKGAMITGWYTTTKGQKYYFKKNAPAKGRMYRKQWVKIGGKRYYMQANGIMAKNKTLTINGKKYRFNSKGQTY